MNQVSPSFERYFYVSVRYRRIFFKLTKSTEAALFLSQAWFWWEQSKDRQGLFWKTRRQWEKETGLNRREQERARAILKKLGFIHEPKTERGIPRKFLVMEQAIYDAITKFAESTADLCDKEFPERENNGKITPIEARRRKQK